MNRTAFTWSQMASAFVAASFLLVASASCSDSSNASPENVGSTPINGLLRGKIVINGGLSRPLYYFDLATGRTVDLPNVDWEYQNDRFPNGSSIYYPTISPYPAKLSESEISLVVRNCYVGFDTREDCMVIQGTNGSYHEQFDLYHRIYNPQISPNKEYVAFYQKQGGVGSNDDLDVYTRDGEWAYGISFDYNNAHDRRFQWLPDGGMLVPYGEYIEILKPYSSESLGARQFPSYEGDIYNLRVSIDGTRMVFYIGSTIFMMGTDGSNLREFVMSGDDLPLLSPVWSPDGKYILFRTGHVNNTGVFSGTNGNFRLYAVPTDRQETLVISNDDSVRSQSILRVLGQLNGVITPRWSNHTIYWKE